MIDHLRPIAIFAKTIEHGSFRGAASELRLSPSVVSHHISQLEEHLGVALLYRSTRKLALTPEGERLLSSAQDMLETLAHGLESISMSASAPTGELRITLPSILAQSDLTAAIGRFSVSYPGVNISLNFSDVRQELIEGGFDLAIRMGVGRKTPLSSKTLFYVERRVVGSSAYIKTQPNPKTPADLADWKWLHLSPVFHIKPTFKKENEKPITIKSTAQINANDARALYHLVLSGAGVAIVPELLAQNDIGTGKVDFLVSDWNLEPIKVFADWHSNAPRKGLIRLFVDTLRHELSNDPVMAP